MGSGFGAVCCVYDDDTWLRPMVAGCYSEVDRLFFLVGHRPWNGERGSNEPTIAAIRACPDPDQKLVIVEDDWLIEHEQRNAGLALCEQAHLPFALIIDADELYDPSTLRFTMALAKLQAAVDAWYMPHTTYWKSYRYRIDTIGHNGQLAFVRVGLAPFVHNRETNARTVMWLPRHFGVCHHMSYARTDEEIQKKITRSSHGPHMRPNWFDDIWRRWDEDPTLEDLHPLHPKWFPRAVPQDPRAYPSALRELYDRDVSARTFTNNGQRG